MKTQVIHQRRFDGASRSEPDRAMPTLPIPSFSTFYQQEFHQMVALAASVAGDVTFAEDIAQEALMRASQRWDTLAGYDKPGTWTRRVVINLALNRKRRRENRDRATRHLAAVTESSTTFAGETDHELWNLVAELPGKQRAAVALHYLDGYSVAEISEVLECSASTTRVHLARGRKTLANRLTNTTERSV